MIGGIKYSYCIVHGCTNTTISKPEYQYFPIPADEDRRRKWLQLAFREDLLASTAPLTRRVCEIHFAPEDIVNCKIRKVLAPQAVPSRYLPRIKKSGTGELNVTHSTLLIHKHTQTEEVQIPSKRKIVDNTLELRKMLRLHTSDDEDETSNERSSLHKLCDKYLTKELADLVKAQTQLVLSYAENKEQVKYKKFCWDLYHTSPEAYKLLQRAMSLPDPDVLCKDIKITSKINDKLISALKRKVEGMKDVERNCSVIVGVMKLEPNMFYSIKEDLIIGFEDINGTRTQAIAEQAVVIMVRGIYSNWKQIMGYALISEYCDAIDTWIDEVLEKLFEIGLKVRTFVSDIKQELFDAAKKRSVTIERPYFHVNNKKIYYVFDAPSLIKMLRDDFMKHDIHFQDKVARYQHIIEFYINDREKEFKLAPKLTIRHIEPKQSEKCRVDLAAQLFSNATSTGITAHVDFEAIEESGKDTAEFIKTVNDIFDMLNSTSVKDKDNKRPFCGEESQVYYLNEMLRFFQELKLVDRDTGKEVTDVHFAEGFSITITSIMLLFEDLKTEQTHLLTGRLNQDVLDNVFEQIRKITGSAEPTCKKFKTAYQKLFISDLMKDPKSDCSKDLERIVVDASKITLDDTKDSDWEDMTDSDDDDDSDDYEDI